MNETEYQIEVQDLWNEMQARANTAVEYLVTQPPLREARHELYALLEWALQAGIDHQDVVRERLRRKAIARKNAAPGARRTGKEAI